VERRTLASFSTCDTIVVAADDLSELFRLAVELAADGASGKTVMDLSRNIALDNEVG
jgi:hypothetical protein